ncbi:nucleotidyltransferase family protein [Nocardioides sp. P5_C9_2]
MTTAGLLLAAGAGRRMGKPKALVHDRDETSWLRRSVQVLLDGGCAPVHVVLGAAADEARALLGDLPVEVVVADDWDTGMGASLRAGLLAVGEAGPDTVLVSLVDLPDVGAPVVARVLAAATGPATLARAAYDGEPGHPVLLGADHLAPLVATVRGDVGAKPYLGVHDVLLVECGDLATGRDRDTA